ncbi:hypothetical protein PRZ48_000239 [Zasmidium cellare]|uniref:Xylanolytic transcriptional activator regulatory domain-containing protein n=1 Tax=Zasmidium cellare TaxID=395010 RepID=A0ABR0EY94_ZASCE|nr:hypothetical protein PRZ48_000239 [Zasmidium cellare]
MPMNCFRLVALGVRNRGYDAPSILPFEGLLNEISVSPSASAEPETNGLPDAAPPIPFALPESLWVGDVEVSTSLVWELFDIYYQYYHPRFPVLCGRECLTNWYNKCPLLLGTTLCVAAENRAQYAPLRDRLVPNVQRLAMDTIGAARNPCLTVQALLLLSWWPLSLDASVLNPSWAYCGLATHTALQFGLHRSQHPGDFRYGYVSTEHSRNGMSRTWLASFIVNQSVSSYLGVPATTPIDHTILAAVGGTESSLPPVLQQHLEIAYYDHQFTQALGNSGLSPTGQTPDPSGLVQSFDRNLHALNLKRSLDWTNSTEVAFLKTRLSLHQFACSKILSPSAKTASRPDPVNTTAISEAERCAERIITLASRELELVEQASSDVRTAMTKSIFFLLKLSATKHSAVNQDLVKDSLRQAWNAYRKASVRRTDQYARICSIIEYLSGVGGQDVEFATTMAVESRMGANFSYDTAWAARARFPKHVVDMRPLDYTAAAESQQTLAAPGDQPEDLLMDPDLMADLFGSDLLGWDFNELHAR